MASAMPQGPPWKEPAASPNKTDSSQLSVQTVDTLARVAPLDPAYVHDWLSSHELHPDQMGPPA